ncbi:DNA ligase 4 [Brachionus plicatilis]|uniref:DNA ligase 4 n=1 Tax=Brachionus plicatilis TaxID=10195 RepID=A0A3M7P955_BRAPC|nr:DNA ligase 4 [Brachionus plicatilis]
MENKNLENTVGSHVTFKSFCNLLEKIIQIDETPQHARKTGKIEEKKNLVRKFIEYWRQTAKAHNLDDNFYPVMRLLLPHDDDRVYGLKETKLAKYLIEALCIGSKTEDALKLLNYRAPTKIKSEGDFAGTAFFILKNRCRDDLTLNMDEINHHLDQIAVSNAKGKDGQKQVNTSIKHLLLNLSAIQLKWLIRIIIKDLKIGIKETAILDAFHPDALDVYNFTSSIEKVCSMLNDPEKRYNELGVQVGSACRPMLGEKAKPNKIEELLGGRQFYIETKFDGERFQMHKIGNKFMYFSRNGYDYTETFGEDIHSGSLTPFIFSALSKEATNLILDGEMCAYNSKEKLLLSKGDDIDVKSARKYDSIQTCFCVFDILLFNDTVLTNRPLKERVEFIRKCCSEIEGRIQYSVQQKALSNQQVVDALNKAIDSRLEGIVVKDPESVYKPSQRGGGWYKVKPDYMAGLNDDLDLIVLGGYYGSGKRGGLISHFLVGLLVDQEGDDEVKKFCSLCKIGSGYTHKELLEYNYKLAEKWKKFEKKSAPVHLELGNEKPDLWIEPKDSIIVQVKAVEVNASEKYKPGCTLRFPRLEKFRPDKQWFECMKLSEFDELRNKNSGKLTNRHLDLADMDNELNFEEDGPSPSKRKRRIGNKMPKTTVASIYRGIDPMMVEKAGDLFQGKEFCISIEDDLKKKSALEQCVAELGGELVQNATKNTYCIIANRCTHRIKSYIKIGLYDVVKTEWLDKCLKHGRLCQWKPNDMIHSKPKTRQMFAKLYDSYGDSYTEDVSVDCLKEMFNSGSFVKEEFKPLMDLEFRLELRCKMAEFENKYFPDNSKYGLFRMCLFYFDCFTHVNVDLKTKNIGLELVELKARWHGGFVLSKIDANVTHCVVDKSDLTRLEKIKEINRKKNRKFRVVSSQWILDSIKAARLRDELSYVL